MLAQTGLEDAGVGTAAGLWLARLADHAALAATVGLLLAAAVLLPDTAATSPHTARRAGAAAACVWALSAAALFVFGLSNAAALPLPEALRLEVVAQFAGTRFGAATLAQAGIAAATAALAAGVRSPAGAAAALSLAALGAFPPAWSGHAGTASPRLIALASDWAHIAAVAVWVGGLAVLAWLALRHRDMPLDGPVHRFSRLAGWSLAVVLATGVVNALLGIDAPGQLTSTTWGRLVLVKAGLLVVLAWLGQRHRRQILPRLRPEQPPGPARAAFRRLALAEVAVMVVGLGVATTMASGIPADAEAAARVQSVAAAFGDRQLNLTVDPATTGPNVVHLYVLDATGRQRSDAADASVTFSAGDTSVEAPLVPVGPGHWTAPAVVLPTPGTWQVRVTATVAGQPEHITRTLTVR